MAYLYELLARRDFVFFTIVLNAGLNNLSESLFADLCLELAYHTKFNIRLQKGVANILQHRIDRRFIQGFLTLQSLAGISKPVGQTFKHSFFL